MSNKNMPKLRFPEFRDKGDWTEDKLANLVTTITPPKKLPTNLYQTTGQYPIFDQSQNYICGWTNDKESLILSDLPLVIFGDHTCVLKIAYEPFAQGADGIKILKAKDQVDAGYLYQALQNNPVVMEEYKRHFSILKEKLIRFPGVDSGEQQKIADCLASIDELIIAQTQKSDALKAHKTALMQQLFPAEGGTVPKLRFPEFRDKEKWKVKKARNLFSNRVEEGEDGLPIYSVTMNGGLAKRSSLDRKIDNISKSSGNKKAYKYDIVYNMMRMWQGASGVAAVDCMVSPAYVVLSPNDTVCADFYGYFFKLPQCLKLLTSHSQGLTKDRLRLYFKDFAQIPLPHPPVSEQQKIADCLSSIDRLITAQTQKIDALKTHKKGLMQQLFPSIDEVNG